MPDDQRNPIGKRVRRAIIGNARDLQDQSLFHALSLTAFLAWVGMGADGLSSSCYGPEEAFLALKGHLYLAVLVAVGSAITVFILSASYSQIIQLFPSGGGGYLVASKMLNPWLGMISGCALLIDYVLTVALSVASGADYLFSLMPPAWHPYKNWLAIFGLVVLTIMNMRGVKETVMPLVPIIITFVATHAFLIVYGLATHAPQVGQIASDVAGDFSAARSQIGLAAVLVLLLRAYSMGAGTFTGIEAVSNGLPVIREPRVQNGKRTMRYMAISLSFMVLGLMLSYLIYETHSEPGRTLNAVLFRQVTAGWGGFGSFMVFAALGSSACMLFVAAQTGFLDGPRVLANMALDRWFPTRFSVLSDRLVTQNGILLMSGTALVLILATGGSVRVMVVLYSITVFITFCLSQLGMVRHWWLERATTPGWLLKLLVNAVGLMLSSFILVAMAGIKFHEGGWVTLVVTAGLVGLALMVRRHYRSTARQLTRLDALRTAAELSTASAGKVLPPEANPSGNAEPKTAVLLVNGFNGLGLHTLLAVMRTFRGVFNRFVFMQVGVIDVGSFKGKSEITLLDQHVDEEGQKYVAFMRVHGISAEAVHAVGVDVVEEVDRMLPPVLQSHPDAVIFGGQLVFEKETIFSRWLHNYTIFALQKRLYRKGIPVIILPIRV